MSNTKQKQWRPRRYFLRGSVASLAVIAVSIIAALLLFLNRQYVIDQLSVWQYKPSQDVTELVERTSLSNHGKFLFYASHPSIDSATEFNTHCSRREMSTAILGCYNGQYIYIYNVTDPRLNGIREVTAAHEMLHAAYVRLSTGEKETLHALLNVEYEKLKTDKNFADRMAFYERTEPGERNNELHSIVGTEVSFISAELESYYKKYFEDRGRVVELHQAYASVFNALQNRSEEIAAELSRLALAIEQESAAYNKDVGDLNNDITDFNDRANNGEFSSNEDFQAARALLVTRAEALEGRRETINISISRYESLRSELTAIARESEALNKSIDSSLAPTPSL